MNPLLEVDDLHVTFSGRRAGDDVHAVRGVGYRLHRGEVLGIVGESGSGKSVSAMAVMGLLPDNAMVKGSAVLDGHSEGEGTELLELDDDAMSEVRGRRIAMIFQDPLSSLTPVYTIGDQLAEAVRVHNRVSREQAWRRAIELLSLVGIPHPEVRARAFPHEFSGGMRQRVMIAMAIANDPDVIIADEPTTALDVTIQAQIIELLKVAQRETNAGIIMITHDLGIVAGIADRVMVMYAGRVVENGAVDEIYYRPRMPYTMGLLGAVPRVDRRSPLVPIEGSPPSMSELPPGCPFAPRCPLVFEECERTEPELLPDEASHRAACHRSAEILHQGMTGPNVFLPRPVPERLDAQARAQRPVVLEVENLTKHHPLVKGVIFKRRVGTVYAVDGVGFDIREGETLGLVGESGCGKTTTLLELLEMAQTQDGRIVVLGKDVKDLSSGGRRALRKDVQVVFQDPAAALDPRLPVSDILAEPLATHGHPRARIPGRVQELLRLVGLDPSHAGRYPREFSGGQRQRVSIARALALEPKLMVLDEPVSALDVSIQAGVINLLDELRERLGLAYLFVAHDLAVVRHVADRVAVMYLGRIVEIGEAGRVYGHPSHPYTQALLSAVPIPDPATERERTRIMLTGDLPSPANPPSGCRFRTRCPKFRILSEVEQGRCVAEEPLLSRRAGDHESACHYAESVEVM